MEYVNLSEEQANEMLDKRENEMFKYMPTMVVVDGCMKQICGLSKDRTVAYVK